MTAKKLDLTSRVRPGMVAARQTASASLAENAVVQTAQRDAAHVIGQTPSDDRASAAAQPGRIKIRVADTVSNPYNPRTFYSSEAIDALAKSMGEQGQIDAIKVTRLPQFPGKYVIVDGERRVRAARSQGDEFIDAELSDDCVETRTLYLRAYHANKEREEQTPFDNAIAWKKLLDERVYLDHAELGAAVGEDPKQVSKVISLTTLPPFILEKMAQFHQVVGLSHAYNIKLIFDRAGQAVADHWLQQVIDGKASVRRLEQAAAAQAATRRAGASRTHYQSRVQFQRADGVSLGELKLFADGRTELSLKGVPGDAQQRLAERMKGVIEDWKLELDGADGVPPE